MTDYASNWTIKAVPLETRQAAQKAANAADLTVGRWLIQAVDRQANLERANQVIPPGQPQVAAMPPELADLDLGGLAAALSATMEAIKAAGATPPKNLGANAAATLNKYMRAVRGLGGPTTGPTSAVNGQTIRLIQGNSMEDRTNGRAHDIGASRGSD